MRPHRNSQKRIHIPDACYFVTGKTLGNEPFFSERILCDLFVENLKVCKQIKEFKLYGWFLGYDHFHLLFRPMGEWDISEIMFSIKKQFSHNANRVMGFNRLSYAMPRVGVWPNTPEPTDKTKPTNPMKADKRLSAFGGVLAYAPETHRLDWVTIRGRIRFILKFGKSECGPRFKWQLSFHDHYCRGETDVRTHLEYIAYNPTKHGLPSNWPYVSTNPKWADWMDPI